MKAFWIIGTRFSYPPLNNLSTEALKNRDLKVVIPVRSVHFVVALSFIPDACRVFLFEVKLFMLIWYTRG